MGSFLEAHMALPLSTFLNFISVLSTFTFQAHGAQLLLKVQKLVVAVLLQHFLPNLD